MSQIHAFDGGGVIVGTCSSPNLAQENKWSSSGLYVLHGPEIRKNLYKYVQNLDLTWTLTPKSQVELDAEAQAVADAKAAEVAKKAQKAQDIIDNLPTWAQVSTAVDNISNLSEAKVFIKKLARIVYWLAKDSQS